MVMCTRAQPPLEVGRGGSWPLPGSNPKTWNKKQHNWFWWQSWGWTWLCCVSLFWGRWKNYGLFFSCCACPNGRGFCSHCLGLLFVFKQAQTMKLSHPDMTSERFVRLMPESPKNTQRVPMLIELCVVKAQMKRSFGQQSRRNNDWGKQKRTRVVNWAENPNHNGY